MKINFQNSPLGRYALLRRYNRRVQLEALVRFAGSSARPILENLILLALVLLSLKKSSMLNKYRLADEHLDDRLGLSGETEGQPVQASFCMPALYAILLVFRSRQRCALSPPKERDLPMLPSTLPIPFPVLATRKHMRVKFSTEHTELYPTCPLMFGISSCCFA